MTVMTYVQSSSALNNEIDQSLEQQALTSAEFDVILSDFSLPQFDGLTALKIARELRPDVPFIFVSGTIGEERAVESLRAGARDYILKDRLEKTESIIHADRRPDD